MRRATPGLGVGAKDSVGRLREHMFLWRTEAQSYGAARGLFGNRVGRCGRLQMNLE